MFTCLGPGALNFTGDGTDQYAISKESPQALKSITACFWMSTPKDYTLGHEPSMLSYSSQQASYGNEFLIFIYDVRKLAIRIKEYAIRYHVKYKHCMMSLMLFDHVEKCPITCKTDEIM